ncbi:MAG TPA: hypothetical protein VL133_05830 [Devosia sp.]|nr:hypothetical protein [Devosia sp.]
MQINRRITNGLAWAGLFVVVAVPLADFISGQVMGDRAEIAIASVDSDAELVAPVPAPLNQRPHERASETVAAVPAKPEAPVAKPAATNPVVDNFLASGKKLPSYITGGDAAPAQVAVAPPAAPAVAKPVAVAPTQTATVPNKPVAPVAAPAVIDPVEVAALPPSKIAPTPMPLSMRPKPVTQPLASRPVDQEIVLPPEVVVGNAPRGVVVDDLQDWESGPLSEFLAQRQGQQQSSATVTGDAPVYYRDRPNRPRRDVYLGPVQDDEVFFPFVN